MSSGNGVSRRDALRVGGLAALGVALGGCSTGPKQDTGVLRPRKRVMRLAHMSDVHIQPERAGYEGMAACLRHCMEQRDRPSMVVTGGDLIMDSFEKDSSRTKLQWDLWTRVFRDECSLPVHHTLGNHDIWGWNKSKSGTTGTETLWGKKWALDELGLAREFYAVDAGTWRVVILDSVQPNGEGYIGRLDEAQKDWLTGELASCRASGTPVVVVSHIPVLGMGAVEHDGRIDGDNWRIPGAVMHIDGQALHQMFADSGVVKLCLSGHIHKNDRIDYGGVSYICDGAVSGAWWRGSEDRCAEGYGLVDLYNDGSFEHRYETYGWVAREA